MKKLEDKRGSKSDCGIVKSRPVGVAAGDRCHGEDRREQARLVHDLAGVVGVYWDNGRPARWNEVKPPL